MDVEDEPNSYLKYLNDSDTPNTYLLGNNEVGLFSVEPIFTEMEASDWPQEGFPLLLTNSLITEDSTAEQVANSQSSNKSREEHLQENNIDNSINSKNIIEIPPIQNEDQLDENAIQLDLPLAQEQIELNNGDIKPNKNCIQLENCIHLDDNCIQLNETNIQLHENESPNNELQLKENGLEVTGNLQLNTSSTIMQLKPNEKYFIVNGSNVQDGTKLVEVVSSDIKSLPNNNPVIKSVDLSLTQKTQPFIQKKTKSVTDLFLTVIANKCKLCGFLCEDLEQIKRHISEKHPEFLFTHSEISTGLSLLISNAKMANPQNNEVKKEFTVFICSECHGVCTDKNDLKKHMIQVHRLTTENAETISTEAEVKDTKTKPVYKKTTFLSDVTVSLVKKQEKAMQKVKCKVKGCVAYFPTEELCETHAKLHIGDTKNYFKCQGCEQTFMMWRIARSHMYKEHELDFGMIVCPMCNLFKSYKAARILKHMMIHREEKPFVCQDCGKAFKQLAQLKNHDISHRTPEDIPSWCQVKKCDKCQRLFANSKSLKSHIQSVHENFRPFICNICGHKTSRKAMLELHSRQHTGTKPYNCDQCSYQTRDPNCLRRHTMKHAGDITYQCPYCPYRCIQAGSFKSHLLHKHEEKKGTFSCKYCSYTTVNPFFLKSHERNHEISSTEGASAENASAIERERQNETDLQTDEETQSCFLNTESQIEETVDNGGITIPAGLEMPLVP